MFDLVKSKVELDYLLIKFSLPLSINRAFSKLFIYNL